MGIVKVQTMGLILLVVLGASLMFGIYNSLVSWHTDDFACLNGKKWIAVVPRQQWFSAGPLHLYYQPFTWDCDELHKYSPKMYNVINGTLSPKTN